MPEYPLLDLATQRPASGHYVYRFHSTAGHLLYIGSTNNFWVRAGRHVEEHKDWWEEVCWDRTVLELVSAAACLGARKCQLPVHTAMLAHEKELIGTLRPRYNLRMTGWCRRGLHLLAEHGRTQLNGTVGCYTCQLERQAAQYDPAKRRAKKAATAIVAGQLALEGGVYREAFP